MDTLLSAVDFLLPLVAAHPYMAIAITVASILVALQPVLRPLVRHTPNKVDDLVLEWLLKLANLLTSKKVERGSHVLVKPPVEAKVSPESHMSGDPDDEVMSE